jgi:hypothetical protein
MTSATVLYGKTRGTWRTAGNPLAKLIYCFHFRRRSKLRFALICEEGDAIRWCIVEYVYSLTV